MIEASPTRPPLLRAPGMWALFVLFLAAPASAQTLGQGTDDNVSIWRVIGAILVGTILAIGGAFALKKRVNGQSSATSFFFGGKPASRRMKLVERLRISPQVELCLVLCDGREMLIATNGQGIQVMDWGPNSAEPIRANLGSP